MRMEQLRLERVERKEEKKQAEEERRAFNEQLQRLENQKREIVPR